MDIKALIQDSSRNSIEEAADEVLKNPALLEDFFQVYINQEKKYSARAARVLYFSAARNLNIIKPYLARLINSLNVMRSEGALMSILKIFTFAPLPEDEEQLSTILNRTFTLIDSKTAKPAHKIYSMEIIYRIIVEKIPELRIELVLLLRKWMPYSSIAFQSRAGRILRKLESESDLTY